MTRSVLKSANITNTGQPASVVCIVILNSQCNAAMYVALYQPDNMRWMIPTSQGRHAQRRNMNVNANDPAKTPPSLDNQIHYN